MVLTKEALMGAIKNRIGDDTSDEALALVENVNDTINDFEEKSKETAEASEWHSKYDNAVKEKNELDEMWKKKYRDRFFSSSEPDDNGKGGNDDKPPVTRFEDLFTTKGV